MHFRLLFDLYHYLRTERTNGFSRNWWLFLYVDVKRDRVEAAGSKPADNFESFRAVCVSGMYSHMF